jgi:hypothetical protein
MVQTSVSTDIAQRNGVWRQKIDFSQASERLCAAGRFSQRTAGKNKKGRAEALPFCCEAND